MGQELYGVGGENKLGQVLKIPAAGGEDGSNLGSGGGGGGGNFKPPGFGNGGAGGTVKKSIGLAIKSGGLLVKKSINNFAWCWMEEKIGRGQSQKN